MSRSGVKWNRADTLHLLVTIATMGVFTGLALYHPTWLLVTVVVLAVVGMLIGWRAAFKDAGEVVYRARAPHERPPFGGGFRG
jgi:MFS superfamily sulfate permease-like transporter